jgi:hypothetical protein
MAKTRTKGRKDAIQRAVSSSTEADAVICSSSQLSASRGGNCFAGLAQAPKDQVAGALVLCRDEVTYSPAQRLRDNLKIEEEVGEFVA